MTDRWTGFGHVDALLCPICCQPECPDSRGDERPKPGAVPSRLARGERDYRGYCEWAVHPDEARFLLHRGYALVDGVEQRVWFIHNEAYVTQIRVANSDPVYVLEDMLNETVEAHAVAHG